MIEGSYEVASDYIQRARSRMATLETRLRRDPAFNDTQFLYQIGEAKRHLAEAHRAGPKHTASAVSQALSEFLTIVPDELSSEHEEYYNKALSETSEALKVSRTTTVNWTGTKSRTRFRRLLTTSSPLGR